MKFRCLEKTMEVEQLDVLSSKESDLLIRSTKKQKASLQALCPERPLRSYKDSLIQPNRDWEDHFLQNLQLTDMDIDSNQDDDSDDSSPLILLSKEDKQRIRAPWRSALIIKAFGKTLGFKYFDYKIRAIWKPQGDLQCKTTFSSNSSSGKIIGKS